MASLAEKSNKPLDPTKVFASGKALRTIATDSKTVQFTIQTYRGPKAPGKDKFDVAFDPPLGEVSIVDKADGSHIVTVVVPADAEPGMKTVIITVAGTGVGIKGSPYHTMVEAGAHGQLREVFRKYDTDGSGTHTLTGCHYDFLSSPRDEQFATVPCPPPLPPPRA